MKIVLRKMGTDFMNYYNGNSDVGNYRVRAEFTDKNGISVVADFGGYKRKEAYKKRSGKIGYKVVNDNALHVDGCYIDEEGIGKDYAYFLKNSGFDFTKYNFTIKGILQFLSDVTGKEFTAIEFVK